MWRDIKLYLHALARHLVWLIAAGPGAAVVLLLWSVFLKTNIPATVFWVAALAGVPVAGFLAWRDEHRKVEPHADVAQSQRLKALADTMVEEYLALARSHSDAGPSALATLGLHALKSDALILEAIQEMEARSGSDPWSGQSGVIEDVDLVKFFALVHQMRFNFLRDGTVGGVAQKVRAAGGLRQKAT